MNTLVILNSDTDIKLMLAQHSITMERPAPPNDVAVCCVQDSGHHWLVLSFFDAADPGYVAYGLPESTPEQELFKMWDFVLQSLKEFAEDRGIDCFQASTLVAQPALTAN